MRYRLQRHDGTDCSATMVPITVLRMVPIQRYRHKIETFMEQTLVTVTYTQPDALSGFGGCFVDSHITLSEEKAK